MHPPVDLGDHAEQGHLGSSDVTVQRIGDADQPVVVEIGTREGPVHRFEPRGTPTPEP